MKNPLPIAISVLIKDKKILLIKRIRGDYVGFWGLPGGKIETKEHVSEAAMREVYEESGIESEFMEHLGFVSEHLMEEGILLQHFLLHVCKLKPKSEGILKDQEGILSWFDLEKLEEIKERIIPSDYLMIENFVKNRKKGYYNCIIEKEGDKHKIRKFE